MSTRFTIFGITLLGLASGACTRTDLRVAIFAYLPNAPAIVEAFEDKFENAHPEIDLDLHLWNPYSDESLATMSRYDIVEIDYVRFHDIVADREGLFGGLKPIPRTARAIPAEFVGPAAAILSDHDVQQRFVPHLICGNFLVNWSVNSALSDARSFNQLQAALDPSTAPLFADLSGKSTLGEHYADAVLDIKGVEFAKDHLASLANNSNPVLIPEAEQVILALASEAAPLYLKHREHFHDYYNGAFAEAFARTPSSGLIGYSERLYYVQMQYLRAPWDRQVGAVSNPIDPSSIRVREFPYAENSAGTPAWVDGFVLPKRSSTANESAIVAFLRFVNSEAGLRPFIQPVPEQPATYLLPASSAAYQTDAIKSAAPALLLYRDAIQNGTPLSGERMYEGIRAAGKILEVKLDSLGS